MGLPKRPAATSTADAFAAALAEIDATPYLEMPATAEPLDAFEAVRNFEPAQRAHTLALALLPKHPTRAQRRDTLLAANHARAGLARRTAIEQARRQGKTSL